MKPIMKLRVLLLLLFAAANSLSSAAMLPVRKNEVSEWRMQSSRAYADPFNEVALDALVSLRDGSEIRVPEFWAGKPLEADAAGSCAVPRGPINQDWVLVLKPEK